MHGRVPAKLEQYPRVMNAYMYNIICDQILENIPYCLTFDIIDNSGYLRLSEW